MKWFLVAMFASHFVGGTPHANGQSMHAWEMGTGDPGRITCFAHVQAFVRQKFPSTASALPLGGPLPPRLKGLVEIEVIESVLCLDEETVRTLAANKLGRDSLEVRPPDELQRSLPKLPFTPDTKVPPYESRMPQLGGKPEEPPLIPVVPLIKVPN